MDYALGIDVGTTYTAAAIFRGGIVETIPLDTYQVAVPSVVFAAGGEILFGAPAVRRGAVTPEGLAREFKRRVGDPVPIMLSRSPYHADRLTALMANWVVDTVSEQLGARPRQISIAHPANWTEYQLGVFGHAMHDVGLTDLRVISEPAAAALDYAEAATVEEGSLLLVYDLGGGTFDVALLRRRGDGFVHEIEPFGIERLGGIDFDEAVFRYVIGDLPAATVEMARQSPEGHVAIANLRRSCVDAKEALSSDALTDVPVMLPGYTGSVRLTRGEFEGMIRPMVEQTIVGVKEVITRARIESASLSAALLVGGSSRIPLVPQMVAQELELPVRVDAHPKLVVAKGAARFAGASQVTAGTTRPPRGSVPHATEHEPGDGGGGHRRVLVGFAAVAVVGLGVGAWLMARGDEDGGVATSGSTAVVPAAPGTSIAGSTVGSTSRPTTAAIVVPPSTVIPSTVIPSTLIPSTVIPSTTPAPSAFRLESLPDARAVLAVPEGWIAVTLGELDDPTFLDDAARRAGVPAAEFRSFFGIPDAGSAAAANSVFVVSNDGSGSKVTIQSVPFDSSFPNGLPTADDFALKLEQDTLALYEGGTLDPFHLVRDSARDVTTANGKQAIDIRYHAAPDRGVALKPSFDALILVEGDEDLLIVNVTSPSPATATVVADNAVATVRSL